MKMNEYAVEKSHYNRLVPYKNNFLPNGHLHTMELVFDEPNIRNETYNKYYVCDNGKLKMMHYFNNPDILGDKNLYVEEHFAMLYKNAYYVITNCDTNYIISRETEKYSLRLNFTKCDLCNKKHNCKIDVLSINGDNVFWFEFDCLKKKIHILFANHNDHNKINAFMASYVKKIKRRNKIIQSVIDFAFSFF